MRLAAQVEGDLLAWLEYDTLDSGCHAAGVGRVMAASVATPDEPIPIAPVGIGCYCCGAYWADVRLSLAGDLLACNHGVADASGDVGPLGWARVRLDCP